MKIELAFLGATGTVTGSKYYLRAGAKAVLVDCGLFQGLKMLRLRNWVAPAVARGRSMLSCSRTCISITALPDALRQGHERVRIIAANPKHLSPEIGLAALARTETSRLRGQRAQQCRHQASPGDRPRAEARSERVRARTARAT